MFVKGALMSILWLQCATSNAGTYGMVFILLCFLKYPPFSVSLSVCVCLSVCLSIFPPLPSYLYILSLPLLSLSRSLSHSFSLSFSLKTSVWCQMKGTNVLFLNILHFLVERHDHWEICCHMSVCISPYKGNVEIILQKSTRWNGNTCLIKVTQRGVLYK